MKRINYIVLIVLAASLGLVACSESYPSVNYRYESVPTNAETPGEDRSVPLMVFVDRQSFFSLSSTRGAGHFDPINSTTSTEDEKDKFRKTPFYLYAFRDPRFTSTSYDNPRLHQLPDLTYTMLATNGGKKDNENLDCLVDYYNYHTGYKTNLDDAGGMILPVKPHLFYYPDYQDVGFNFFAYSIDDAVSADDMTSEPQATRTPESIYYDLAIDGTQDIMCGFAPEINEQRLNDSKYYGKIKLTETEKKRILDIGSYCTYAGHRNIHPYINIHHQLTRLDFVAYPGEKEADYVTIDRIAVQAPMKGRLVVAANDTTQIGYTPDPASEGWFVLREGPQKNEDGKWDCPEMPAGKYRTNPWHEEYNPKDNPELAWPIIDRIWPGEEKVCLGGESACIMLPESEEFLVKILATYDPDPNDPTKKRRFESVYRLKPQQSEENLGEDGIYRFQSGRYYTIAVAVYGLKEIELFTEIGTWKPAGEITIDPDNPEEADIY